MGTRNITSVILAGKQMVCQYGQWDGYPSWTGTKILEFLRDADLKKFKRALANTTIKVADYQNAVSYTGSTKDYSKLTEDVYEAKRALSDRDGKWPDTYGVYQYMLEQGHSEDDLENYFVWTRDTGCDVLPLIYHRSLEKPPYELAAMTDDYNGEYARDIQGVYVINLDDHHVKMTFDGYSCEFDMNNLPENIETTMLVFEKATYKLYENKDHDFTSFSDKNQPQDPLQKLASDLAVQICKEIKTEYFDLLPDKQSMDLAKNFGQEFMHTQLQKQAEKQMNTLTAKISAADQKAAALAVSDSEKAPGLQ